MAKNVLVVTGSPRKGGNSDLLAEAFMKGAKAAGHETALFNAAADPVLPCRACDACWSKGKACVFDDGFDRLAPMLEKADMVVWCGPVYWFTFSAQLKSAMDKMYSFMVPQAKRKMKQTETALLLCAEDTDMNVFTGAVEAYKSIAKSLELTDRGQMLVPGVLGKGAVKDTDALARAERLGRSLA